MRQLGHSRGNRLYLTLEFQMFKDPLSENARSDKARSDLLVSLLNVPKL